MIDLIRQMPWYEEYLWMKEHSEIDESELDTPQMQLQRVKDFFEKVGAEPSKNAWIAEEENRISSIEEDHSSRKTMAGFANIVDWVIRDNDPQAIAQLKSYRNDERFTSVISAVMFYVGVSMVKTNRSYTAQAYNAIKTRYPITNTSLFIKEGMYYYILFFRNVRELLEANKGTDLFYMIQRDVDARIRDAWQLLSKYETDEVLGQSIRLVQTEIRTTKNYMDSLSGVQAHASSKRVEQRTN
jgi:hypothetical protein